MNKNEEPRKEEQRLYEMLFDILDYYANQRASFDPTDISAHEVVSSIKKNISKCATKTKIDILGRIITTVNNRILANDGTRFIFHDAIDQSLREKVDRKKVKKISSLEKTEEEKKMEQEKKDKLLKHIAYLVEMFDNADRDMMYSLEKDINKKIMNKTGLFGIPNGGANIDVISRLNSGMYGKNQSQLITELESKDIKVTKKNKLSGVMNDDLFKYRLAALTIALDYCSESKDYIKPKTTDSHYNRYEYYKLLNKIRFIGETVAKSYEKEYGKTPRISLIEDPYDKKYESLLSNPQIMLDELLEEGETTIKNIRRDKK